MTNFYVSVVFLYCLVGALAQIASEGSCPEIEIMQNFDISKFLGRWYELEQYFIPTMDHIQCVTYDWQRDENGNTMRIETIMSLRTGIRVSTPGVMKIPNSTECGKMKQKYVWSTMESDYWILETDYESYAVAYNCINGNLMHNQFAWIMTRDENPSDCVMSKIADVLEQHKLNRSKFTKTNHDDCEGRRNDLYGSENSFPWQCICLIANIIISILYWIVPVHELLWEGRDRDLTRWNDALEARAELDEFTGIARAFILGESLSLASLDREHHSLSSTARL